jgi:RHS repeat-associated protein
MSYNERGELIEKDLHSPGVGIPFLQRVDYGYNIRGWLEKINDPDLSDGDGDLFGMELLYKQGFSELDAPEQYNGNISGMKWHVNEGDGYTVAGYGFEYDDLNRLKHANGGYKNGSGFTDGSMFDVDVEYDKNGNIGVLSRNDANGSTIDFLEYSYEGNQLTSVEDIFMQDDGFYDGNLGGTDYTYDKNGNMITDANKGINQINYNLLNLPQQISFGSTGNITYDYDATGMKWKKTTSNGVNLYYCGNFVYDGNGLSYILMDEGRLLPDGQGGFEYEYFLKDHLGNTRVSFKENGDTAMITQEDHYYPFGMTMAGLSYSNGVENKYLYNPESLGFSEPLDFRGSLPATATSHAWQAGSKNNADRRSAVFRDGKELQNDDLGATDLDWYDYGARFYNPALGRFLTQDAYAEKYLNFSPYQYAANNPVMFIDYKGLEVVS